MIGSRQRWASPPTDTFAYAEGNTSAPGPRCPDGTPAPCHKKAPLTAKDQKRYDDKKAQALKDIFNPDCVAFCLEHNIDVSELASAIENQQAFDGSHSTLTQQEANVGIPNRGIVDSSQSVASAFRGNSSINAAASVNGNDAYFRGGGFLSSIFGNSTIQEGTIEHEALHNMFMVGDTRLQVLLGLPQNASDTTNITKALEDHHCTK